MMKKFMLAMLLTISSVTATLTVHASNIPLSAGKDTRITTVIYDENNVVEVKARPGVVTQIVLQKGEEYEAHAFGDADAWHFSSYKNNLFLKPAQPLGTTNLSVITNKRDYMFKVNFVNENDPTADLYQVRFSYPDEVAKADEGQKVETQLEAARLKKIYNLDYVSKGNQSINPVNVYDDGNFTYFKFAGNTDLPAIYAVTTSEKDSNGEEMLVDRSVIGEGNNIIVMHKVNPWWRLRLGEAVLDIHNLSMTLGALNTSGTVAPDVERVIKLEEASSHAE